MYHLITLFPSDRNLQYEDLNYGINRLGRLIQIGPFCWVIRTSLSSEEICQKLRDYIDNDEDSIFVCAFDHWQGYNISKDIRTWLDKE